ncbi:MAG: hypothetical protein AAGG50_07335 [Bacteroidota bacterium]
MPQTLFALLAILVLSLYALGQHRSEATLERGAIGGQMELIVGEVARELLTEASQRAFDEVDLTRDELRFDTRGLTTALGPDGGETAMVDFDDVDDFNGYTATVTRQRNGQAIPVTVAMAVRYVQPDAPGTVSAAPTLAKEVVVAVTDALPARDGRPPVAVTLNTFVTPSWKTIHG